MKRVWINRRMWLIYVGIILLFLAVFMLMNYAFRHSRNLLIEQEAGIIAQYMNRNDMALEDVTDSIRKLSAASSTNTEVTGRLNQSFEGDAYSSRNAERIRAVEEALTFYRNIFFDYRLHYIIAGADGSVYSVADGIDNSHQFGETFAGEAENQIWYRELEKSQDTSCWVTSCFYTEKGSFSQEGERYLMFVRKIRDYNSQRFLGVSFVSFPMENLSQILVPNEDSCLVLLNERGELMYKSFEGENGSVPCPEQELIGRMDSAEGYFHWREEGKEYLVNYVRNSGTGWLLANFVPLAKTTQAVDNLYSVLSVMMFLVAFGALLVCSAMYIYVNAPLNRLVEKISQVNIGGMRIRQTGKLSGQRGAAFGIVEAEREIGRMVDHIERLSAETIKQREIQQNLRYEMLRAQLNPHFLFNTLNVIKWSAMTSGAANIAGMITSLGILLENSTNRKGEMSPLREEFRIVKAWVDIKNWALKNRIALVEEIPAELLDFRVLRFCLQPIVENAVLHGMEHAENGEIRITACRREDRVCVTVRDNGIGIDEKTLQNVLQEMEDGGKRRHVTGIGLASIHELMKMKYGEGYGLRLTSVPGCGTQVDLIFPWEEERNVEGSDR